MRIRISRHACARYAEHHPLNARPADLRRAMDNSIEVDKDMAFALSSGNPLHPSMSGESCRFFVTRDGFGMFVLKPDKGRNPNRLVMPTYLRLPQDPKRDALLQEIGVR
jgi:hypothetical protein